MTNFQDTILTLVKIQTEYQFIRVMQAASSPTGHKRFSHVEPSSQTSNKMFIECLQTFVNIEQSCDKHLCSG